MKPLTRADLNVKRCSIPGCDHSSHAAPKQLWMYSACCKCSRLAVVYVPARGVIVIHCGICDKVVNEVLVAEGASA